MTDREYPRDWYRTTRRMIRIEDIRARTFVGETEHTLKEGMYRGSRRFTKKQTSYDMWFPTREEAEAYVRENVARHDATEAARRLRDAAPDLLMAAKLVIESNIPMDGDQFITIPRDAYDALHEAVAHAEDIAL